MRWPLRLSISLFCGVMLFTLPCVTPARAGSKPHPVQYVFEFETVADTETWLPDGSQVFTAFTAPSLSDGEIAFVGQAVGSRRIYVYDLADGTLHDVADRDLPSISRGRVAFRDVDGISVLYSSGIRTVAVTGATLVPGASGTFASATTPSIEKDDVAFKGFSWLPGPFYSSGIYAEIHGKLVKIADTQTLMPGVSWPFDALNGPAIDRGRVAFRGEARGPDGHPIFGGVYVGSGGSLSVVADFFTQVPGAHGTFGGFAADPAIDGRDVAFGGSQAGYGVEGVYARIGGVLQRVADTNTPVPGGVGCFRRNGFGQIALEDGVVVFRGRGVEEGVYTNLGGQLRRIIDSADVLDGKPIARFQFATGEGVELSSVSIEDSVIAFQVYFEDQSQGIYTARPVEVQLGESS